MRNEPAYFSYRAPFGRIWIALVSGAVCRVSLKDDKEGFLELLVSRSGRDPFYQESPFIHKALDRYFKKDREALAGLDTIFIWGTAFQQLVWQTLREIPYGQTRSYAWLAAEIGSPGACRAVGSASRANPLPLIFPCHRVIKADGGLGGYMGSGNQGEKIKRFLLNLEKEPGNQ
ncbi:MAG: methylated-DNA--[protein]-cysteine S-methyltransferase [bacterium]